MAYPSDPLSPESAHTCGALYNPYIPPRELVRRGRWYEGDYLGDRKSGEGKFCWPDGATPRVEVYVGVI